MSDAKTLQGISLARYAKADVSAIQALNVGNATPEQQARALKWIIENACATYSWSFTESERQTNVMLGRQFAGQQIVGLLKLNVSELK